eukprot:Nk52_evm24s1485 gene=Nk52_evmTU24s1485
MLRRSARLIAFWAFVGAILISFYEPWSLAVPLLGRTKPLSRSTREHLHTILSHNMLTARDNTANASAINALRHMTCDLCKSQKLFRDGIKDLSVFQNGEVLGHNLAIVAYQKELHSIMVVWRGTVNTENWLEDAMIKQVPWKDDDEGGVDPSILVHQGFKYSIYSAGMQARMKAKIDILMTKFTLLNPLKSPPSITVTGFSLGAAEAVLSALDLRETTLHKNIQLVTMANPRVGNYEFAQYFASVYPDALHLTLETDPIPLLPGWTKKWSSVGTTVFMVVPHTEHKTDGDKEVPVKELPSFFDKYRICVNGNYGKCELWEQYEKIKKNISMHNINTYLSYFSKL